jgi:carbamoyltransferase
MSIILGINAYHAGASATLLINGEPVAAIAEERLNRIKYYAGFPTLSIKKCLEIANVDIGQVDHVAVGRDFNANKWEKIKYTFKNPSLISNLSRIKSSRNKLNDLRSVIASELDVDKSTLKFKQHNIEHHIAHIASSYFISPWEKCAGFSVDGSGDFVTTMFTKCEGNEIKVLKKIFVPNSLGSLYTMVCEFIGYTKYGDEGKIMGLAPYGTNTYKKLFDDLVKIQKNGFKLNNKYFNKFGTNQGVQINEKGEAYIDKHFSDEMKKILGNPTIPYSEITQRDMDLAYGLQNKFEEVYLHLLNELYKIFPEKKVCIAGGGALNSVANGKIFDQTKFEETCIQPAAGDDGLSLGAALYVYNSVLGNKKRYVMKGSYLGPEYSDDEIKVALETKRIPYTKFNKKDLIDSTVNEIASDNVVGWFQGKMEWGPRALGNRSILGNPSSKNMKEILNSRIKRREWFRPFAPVVLEEKQSEIFENNHPSPHMLHVYKIKKEWRDKLSAVNHNDNTGRLQTVKRNENQLYYDLVESFGKKTGVPVLLNTSFNENEPIVCNPHEAIDCFTRTKMDILVIGSFFCKKTDLIKNDK